VAVSAVEPSLPPYTPPPGSVPTDTACRTQMVVATVLVFGPLIAIGAAIATLWDHGISWLDLGLTLGLYVFTGMGLAVGFHRLFTHNSFVPRRWLRITLAIAGTMAIEGTVTSWVSQHRRHHFYSDRPGDPHSPVPEGPGTANQLLGLWHAHAGWLFTPSEVNAERWGPDLLDDPDVAFITRTAGWWIALSFVLPTVIGLAVTGTWWGALMALLWAGVVRMALLHHVTWGTNSLCHVFGRRPFRTKDNSTNFAPLAILTFGDSWHNAHHAFPGLARHGVDRGQIDIGAWTIRLFERMGWATGARWPRPELLALRRIVPAVPAAAAVSSPGPTDL